jgi:hypothetical protein
MEELRHINVVAQRIMTEFKGAKTGSQSNGLYKTCLIYHETKRPLEFIGPS